MIMVMDRRTARFRRRRGKHTTAAAATTALLACAAVSWGVAEAAFSNTNATGANAWTTGTVAFDANSPATAIFTVTGAWPGSTSQSCVKVSYTGSLSARVRLYVAAGGLTGSGLGTYLSWQVNEGTGDNADCSDFVKSANDHNATGYADYSKSLAAFAGSSTSHATGVSAWDPAGSATRTFQFVFFLQPYNAAIGRTAAAALTWEAQS